MLNVEEGKRVGSRRFEVVLLLSPWRCWMASSCSSRTGAPTAPPIEEGRAGGGRGGAAGGGDCWGSPTRRGSSDAKIRVESVPGDDLVRRSTSARDLESGIKGTASGLPRISLRHVDVIHIEKLNPRVFC